jgi:L-lactate dehydrogenase complex protein LldG
VTSRETILGDIRRHLGRASSAPPPAPPVRLRVPEVTRARRIESMLERVAALAGKAIHARSAQEATDYVEGVTRGRTWVGSNAPFLRELGFASGITDKTELRRACATAGVGITSADYALADTGSLVMIASPDDARLISLLPPVHIAVVPAESILTGLDELYTLIPRPADRTSSMVFITGPSRTADIEQILVRGVHGPGEIHVVIVE